jgi:hypothetical protein
VTATSPRIDAPPEYRECRNAASLIGLSGGVANRFHNNWHAVAPVH